MKQKKSFPYELIGEIVEIVDAKNKHDLKIKGKIVDETKSTIIIKDHGKIKRLFKQNIIIKLMNSGQLVEGKQLLKRSEERIKG